MDLIDVGAKQDAVLRDLARATGGGDWEELRLFWSAVAPFRALFVHPRGEARRVGPVDPPHALDRRLADLRDAMDEPGRGTWLLAEITVHRSGRYTVDFTYDPA